MPEGGLRDRSAPWGGFAAAAAIAAAGAAGTLVQAALLEQPMAGRTLTLAGVAGAGALIAAMPLAFLAWLAARRWPGWARGLVGALAVAAAFIPATMFAFAVKIRLVDGRIEADTVLDLSADELVGTLLGAMGLFTPTGLRLLWPWPVVAVALAACICFTLWPRRPTDMQGPP